MTKTPKDDDGITANDAIGNAIFMRHWLQFRIGPDIYVIEPHAYGITDDAQQVVLGWVLLVAGKAPIGPQGLVLFQTNEMRDVRMQTETFSGPRPGYMRANVAMRTIHSAL
jgi:hypothetical protein